MRASPEGYRKTESVREPAAPADRPTGALKGRVFYVTDDFQ